MAEIVVVEPDATEHPVLRAIDALRRGGLIIVPTETVYGIAGLVNADVARRMFELKDREADKPLPIIGPSLDVLADVVGVIPPPAPALARRYWPGPLTLVLPKAKKVDPIITAKRQTIGVRVPDHPFTLELLRALGEPLIATSANLSDEAPAIRTEQLPMRLVDSVDAIFDAGPCPLRQSSTVLDLTASPPLILRMGPITAESIRSTLEGWEPQSE